MELFRANVLPRAPLMRRVTREKQSSCLWMSCSQGPGTQALVGTKAESFPRNTHS